MSDLINRIYGDFDKKNEMYSIKDFDKFSDKAFENISNIFDRISKDIQEQKDYVMAMEFTKCIGELLRKNGVMPKISEYQMENHAKNHTENKIEMRYGVNIDELDFSEHDKAFEDKIARLESSYHRHRSKICDLENENYELKQRIAELESKETETCEKEPKVSDSAPSIEWYENRHQSDCIEINRLNTTIDVLIHKVEYLRQFAGLE